MDKRQQHRRGFLWRAVATACLCIMLPVCTAAADTFREQLAYGNALLNSGDFEGAREVYRGLQVEHPENEAVYYSLGCADYEEGSSVVALQDPEGAIELFSSARDAFKRATTSRDKSLRVDASYNHANTMAQIAKQTVALGDQKATIAAFEEAVASYEGVLERYPEHKEARHNLDHIRYLLKRMLQVPPPEQQQEEEQQQQEGEQDQQQDQQQGTQEQQDGDQPQEEPEESEDQAQQQPDQQEEEGQPQQQPQQLQAEAPRADEEKPGEEDPEEMQDRQTIEAILQSLEAQDKREQQDLRTSVPDSQIRREWW